MRKVEVRCCCQPQKLLGWVTLHGRAEEALAEPGRFLLVRRAVRVCAAPCWPPYQLSAEFPAPLVALSRVSVEEIRFAFDVYNPARVFERSYVALKAEGYEGQELASLLASWHFEPAAAGNG